MYSQGISSGVALGKLDQKNSHFEVDFVIGRDIRKIDIGNIVGVLSSWCENCDSTLSTIETQVEIGIDDSANRVQYLMFGIRPIIFDIPRWKR